MVTFSELLRSHRAAQQKTFAELGAEVGYHASHLSLVERGMRGLDEAGVVRVAQALRIDPSAALLASLRQRLPEDLRSLVPAVAKAVDPSMMLTAARELQAQHFEYEVERIRLEAHINWDGDLHSVRTYQRCRPLRGGQPVWQLRFRERVVGVEPDPSAPGYPRLNVSEEPGDTEYELTSRVQAGWVNHAFSFPRGWRRGHSARGDAFTFHVETTQLGAYALDASTLMQRADADTIRQPLQGALSFHVPHVVKALELSLRFPENYQPVGLQPWAWWGVIPLSLVSRNLAGTGGPSRSIELRTEGSATELYVEEPLAGYTFAIVWTPADRHHYLEARYATDKQH